MKKIMKLALIVAITSFATVANAQTLPTLGGTPHPSNVVSNVDSIQVDWVTVGAVMPYSTSTSQTNFDTWLDNVQTAFGGAASMPEHLPIFRTQWSVANWTGGVSGSASNETNIGAPGTDIVLTWTTRGQFLLKATTTIRVNNADAGCTPAISGKHVFVLPEPNVTPNTNAALFGHGRILNCNTPSHMVRFDASGIGQRQVRYTVHKQPMTGSAAPVVPTTHQIGDARAATDFEMSTRTFAAAEGIAAGSEPVVITVDELTPGFIYTVTITGISDQISRKSKVGPENDGFVVPSNATAVFAVIPTPEGSRIQHVANDIGVLPVNP